MLELYANSGQEVGSILEVQDQQARLRSIDSSVVNDLIEFLFPFRNATKALEGDLAPTINHVYVWHRKHTECFRASSDDSGLMDVFRSAAVSCVLCHGFPPPFTPTN